MYVLKIRYQATRYVAAHAEGVHNKETVHDQTNDMPTDCIS